MTLTGLSRVLVRLAPLYAALGAVFVAISLVTCIRAGLFGFDFHGTTWEAGKFVLHGQSPYPPADAATLLARNNPPVYPAPTLVLTSPFSLLPATASAALWDILSLIALLAALRLVGVRDWRVFAVVLLSCPAFLSFKLAQLDSFLALGCALAWHWRRAKGMRLAICVGAMMTLKLLLWPLVVWLFAIGRRRQAVAALGVALAEVVIGWSVIGFSSLRSYPHLMSAETDAFGTKGYSLLALGTRLGLSASSARVLPILGAAALCIVCVRLARRGREADALLAAVAAGLIGSPVLWLQYALILMVVLAIKRPTFSPVWAAALLFWVAPDPHPTSVRAFVVGFVSILLLVALGLAPRRRWRAEGRTHTLEGSVA
jgi:hypothetical protein